MNNPDMSKVALIYTGKAKRQFRSTPYLYSEGSREFILFCHKIRGNEDEVLQKKKIDVLFIRIWVTIICVMPEVPFCI